MTYLFRNQEHYYDPTAGAALKKITDEGWKPDKVRLAIVARETAPVLRKLMGDRTIIRQEAEGSLRGDRKAPQKKLPDSDWKDPKRKWRLVYRAAPAEATGKDRQDGAEQL